MKETVTFSDFTNRFRQMDRYDQFGYTGLEALYNWLEDLSEDTGEEYDLDVIALCCEFTVYSNLAELQENYTDIESREDLEDHTTVIDIENSDGFIIQDF